jgi:uncharacterized BrkB/YihY/UPF0761 family membrane protein
MSESLFDKVAEEPAKAASGSRPADEEQRESAWLRRLKVFSIILVPAIVVGVVFALGDYVRQYTATMEFDRAVARGWVQLDTWDWFRRRFLLGVCAGAAFGLLYVIQRNLRNRVP